jgi:hypothetical protein
MKLENFEKIVELLKEASNQVDLAYKAKIDLIDFTDTYSSVITLLIKEIYGVEGEDIFSYFCYERDFGEKEPPFMWDKDGNPICYDVKSLWEYLEQLKKDGE